jgi:hypothetical protein
MPREDYEERRSALEERHRADVALLTAAHELRLHSLERLWREGAGGEPEAAVPEHSAVAAPPAATVREAVPEAAIPVARPLAEVGDDDSLFHSTTAGTARRYCPSSALRSTPGSFSLTKVGAIFHSFNHADCWPDLLRARRMTCLSFCSTLAHLRSAG